jgi:Arc/MetJ-type ribon-helix-helix transcriptional regulator
MTIDFDRETQALIEQEVKAGHFPDAAAFVDAAVRHFLISREDLGYSREQIDTLIDQSIVSLERGEGMDGEEFFAELEREERKLERQRG